MPLEMEFLDLPALRSPTPSVRCGASVEFEAYCDLGPLSLEDLENFNLLEWWEGKQAIFPNLSRMARQFLACPASSAFVESVFSHAKRLHGDLSRQRSECSLQQMLIATYNNNPVEHL